MWELLDIWIKVTTYLFKTFVIFWQFNLNKIHNVYEVMCSLVFFPTSPQLKEIKERNFKNKQTNKQKPPSTFSSVH